MLTNRHAAVGYSLPDGIDILRRATIADYFIERYCHVFSSYLRGFADANGKCFPRPNGNFYRSSATADGQ